MADAGVSASSSGAAVAPSSCFTLRDYLIHQRTLRELQRAQDVWLVDDLLDLRYRARLQLCFAPHPQLRLTDTADGSAAALVVPLGAACRVDTSGTGPDAGLRLTFSSEAEMRLVHLVPGEAPGVGGPAAVAAVWATVLRQLCRPGVPALMAAALTTAPATPPPLPPAAAPSVAAPAPAHVDPLRSDVAAGALRTPFFERRRGSSRAQSSPLRALMPHDAEDISSALDELTYGLGPHSRPATELLRRRQLQHQQLRPASAGLNAARASPTAVAEATAVPRRGSSEQRRGGADAAVSLDGVPELERPPTMAHAGVGLVPELSRYAALRATASFPGAGDEDDEDDEDGVGSGPRTDADGAEVNIVGGGGGGGGGALVEAVLSDSTRPQAPRGGHVGDLGPLGPPRDDAEALRMYNEIHGIHSSSSSSSSSCSSERTPSALHTSSHRETGNASSAPPPSEQQRQPPSA